MDNDEIRSDGTSSGMSDSEMDSSEKKGLIDEAILEEEEAMAEDEAILVDLDEEEIL